MSNSIQKSLRKNYEVKHLISCIYLVMILAVLLSGCASSESKITPMWTPTQTSSSGFVSLTSTITPQPMETATPPPVTLEPKQAQSAIRSLLQKPVDCNAPCFWGINPGKTTIAEARNIFAQFGLELVHTNTQDNKDFYALIYDFDSGLRISPVLMVQNDIVKNINIGINPETFKKGVAREWSAYSPETLINRYGLPSKVDFSIGNPPKKVEKTTAYYNLTMYFEAVDLLVRYEDGKIHPSINSRTACPVTDEFTLVRIWLGQNPEHSPLDEVPLEDATPMTKEEFSKLMMGDPNKACFSLKAEIFP